ncbi:prepilin-type N-terminal cleavage/methylation domain-containing protein [Clostridium manihotivorum]|uniref:Prepilin-type N-terminal cleavage/methylation domain-containing protein n=1 Tax=Clostridium manihotivorum TaxID=2320868 RepID=A0A3R5V6B0_9CLOT|nr:prepilin-type N-terminal cleavage/methylation domain-containing protein [Clostridium manihotivorum]QAA31162.1 hypothetical protein C1I91_05495 [Clostridium manihotivorum]
MLNALTSRLKKKKKGFTLIELIIVMAIIVIIAAIAIPSFSTIRENSKVKADNASADTIKKTVITLVTDGGVNAGNSFDVVATTGGVSIGSASINGTLDSAGLLSYFKQVGAIQEKGKTKYHVVVGTDESVTVTATN